MSDTEQHRHTDPYAHLDCSICAGWLDRSRRGRALVDWEDRTGSRDALRTALAAWNLFAWVAGAR